MDTLGLNHNRPPPWTNYEKKQLRKFTYDTNPIKEFREFSDIHVISMCNGTKKRQIHNILGPGVHSNLLNPNMLYKPNSEIVNRIARMLCEDQCYFNPGSCFFDDQHSFDFKDLLKKDLHDRLNPYFKDILNEDLDKVVTLRYDRYHHPETVALCEEVGFTTNLEYNEEGLLDLNYDLFCRQLWDHDTPLFVFEEKKVLDSILALLLSASTLYSAKRDEISRKYAQNENDVNKPVLSIMHHGPGIGTVLNTNHEECDMESDEGRSDYLTYVSHTKCKNYTEEDYWMYKHKVVDDESKSNVSTTEEETSKCGPASLADHTVVYPCDKGHWHQCDCENCTLLRKFNCKHHKMHLKHNINECFIREALDCDEHHIEHPENFKPGDAVIDKNILFHNGQLFHGGRNYRNKRIILAGLPVKCNKCRNKIQDHYKNHHVLHLQCDLCLFESKTSDDAGFWDKVCKICGKKFDRNYLKEIHLKKHDKDEEQCEYCGKLFVSKFNFQRHLIEQHDVYQHANNGPYDGLLEDEKFKYECAICMKEFKYERNVYAHMYTVHYKRIACQCNICGQNITKKSNLKRHLAEQHQVINTDRELPRESLNRYECEVCLKQFKRKTALISHMEIHKAGRKQYECNQCGGKFATMSNLGLHQKLHGSEQNVYKCGICTAEFIRKGNLREHMKTHDDLRQEFKCRICDKVYYARRTLSRHMIIHH